MWKRIFWKKSSTAAAVCNVTACMDLGRCTEFTVWTDRSHTTSVIDWKWNVGQTETSKWFNNNHVVMIAESSYPSLLAERVICTLSNLKSLIWKCFWLHCVDGKTVEPRDRVVKKQMLYELQFTYNPSTNNLRARPENGCICNGWLMDDYYLYVFCISKRNH